jgi:hypothetical protein
MARMLLALAVVALQAWASPAQAGDAPGAPAAARKAGQPTRKAQAPVRIETVLGDGVATVTVHFDADATDASVGVRGVDGLAVTSDRTPVSGARFSRGQSITFDLAFQPGPGQGHLAVSVGGTFSGSRRNAVSSFAVGKPTPQQLKPAGTPAADEQGRPVKIMPGEPR